MTSKNPHISVAPMMDWTDRHCRYFHRLIAPNVRLYTEMVTTGALIHGDSERFLRFHEGEKPLALQLGGSDPSDLARCTKMAANFGYDEVNLNCGCPSDRVQKGRIGACLMKEPDTVANCFEAMSAAVDIPITIKCRVGVDEFDSEEFLDNFVGTIADKGCKTFILHARKAFLEGLSPKENREVPPLNYERVYKIKKDRPDLTIILNGGVTSTEEIQTHRQKTDGVMIGREAYKNPYFLADIEGEIFESNTMMSREEIARAMIPYAQMEAETHATPIKSITRHIIGLYHGQPGGKAWRQALSTLPYEDDAKADIIEKALEQMQNRG